MGQTRGGDSLDQLYIEKYLIKRETLCIMPFRNPFGEWHAEIVGMEDGSVLVKGPPHEVMNDSLQQLGSNLKGAMKGTKKVLGKVSMPPVRLCGLQDMFWFPHKAPFHEDCVWFSLHGIEDVAAIGENKCAVLLINGKTVHLDISEKLFKNRMARAESYKYRIEKATGRTLTYLYNPPAGFKISE
jgi:competence protein ComK